MLYFLKKCKLLKSLWMLPLLNAKSFSATVIFFFFLSYQQCICVSKLQLFGVIELCCGWTFIWLFWQTLVVECCWQAAAAQEKREIHLKYLHLFKIQYIYIKAEKKSPLREWGLGRQQERAAFSDAVWKSRKLKVKAAASGRRLKKMWPRTTQWTSAAASFYRQKEKKNPGRMFVHVFEL